MLKYLPRPAIIAHRGACAYAPENTLAAFDLALRQGADAIELDAKLSADGEVVVFHDQTLERTTGASGRVGKTPLKEIRQLDAGSHFDVAYRGEKIPTLDEVFEAVGRLLYINVELTNYASPLDSLPDKVAAIVKRHNLSNRVLFSSFNVIALLRARRLLPQTPAGLLTTPGAGGAFLRSPLFYWLGYQSLHPEARDAQPALVQRAHRRGLPVLVYTVNQADEMRRLFDIGVDGIFTDDPLLGKRMTAGGEPRLAGKVR
jgi:glycerophosphoryl diester phosphodiesterase